MVSSPVKAAPPLRRQGRKSLLGSTWVRVVVLVVLIAVFLWAIPKLPVPVIGIGIGLVLILVGRLLGRYISKVIKRKAPTFALDWNRASQSGALGEEVRKMIELCKGFDQRILGLTMAKMVSEVELATASGDRQSALMNVAQLSQQLDERLSPWYVRKEKLLTFLVTAVGIVSGIVSIISPEYFFGRYP